VERKNITVHIPKTYTNATKEAQTKYEGLRGDKYLAVSGI
jgi:hypothetical protein